MIFFSLWNKYSIIFAAEMKLKDPDKIKAIHAATLQLVSEVGLAGLNMNTIGKRAGIGMGTLYVYFKSKEDLINALYRELKLKHTSLIYHTVDMSLPYKLNMQLLVENYMKNRFKYFQEHLFIEQSVLSHFLDSTSLQLEVDAYAGIYALLREGQRQLLVKTFPVEILASHMVGGANEIVADAIRKGKKLSPKSIECAFEMCWDSIQR